MQLQVTQILFIFKIIELQIPLYSHKCINLYQKMKNILVLAIALLFVGQIMCLQRKNYLKCGQYLKSGQFIESNNGYYLIIQGDCNVVLYRSKHFVGRNALWSSKTNGQSGGCRNPVLVNQLDGNVVAYNNYGSSSQRAIWNTGTNNANQCYNFVMQEDGNLVLYDQSNKALWNTGTNA